VADGFGELELMLGRMLQNLSPAERARALRRMGGAVAAAQSRRIAAQLNPDGSAFEPRKPREAEAEGAARPRKLRGRAMFRKLRSPRFLKKQFTDNSFTLSFAGRASRIAEVHQRGLRDRVRRGENSPEAEYPARKLLGLTDSEMETIRAIALDMAKPRS